MTAGTARPVELVRSHALSNAEREAVLNLQISTEQLEFAGPVGKSVAACEVADVAEVAGLAIRVAPEIVGWVALKRGASAPGWVESGAVAVSGLRIDSRHQGRGIGPAALAEMGSWVRRHWPESSRLVLRVDDGNGAGIRAYEKAGWVEIGERLVGRVGLERTMTLVL
jgi:ribosomal protein S18 acetylase RimI-like enzyme